MDIKEYFQSYHNYFWQWEEDAQVIAIPNATTIAYREFTEDILEKIAEQGLPPFGSLLLAITATNPSGSQSIDSIYHIVSSALKTTDEVTLTRAISFLKLLSELPKPYKEGNKKIILLQVLFERCHQILSIHDSKKIANAHKKNELGLESKLLKRDFNHAQFNKDFRTVALLDTKFRSVDDIIHKIASLPAFEGIIVEQENEVFVDKANTPSDFIDELIGNERTFQVGSLIRRIWSGLNIPVHSSLPSQQPLGGVSDLTNKGDFDRLLISEFAYDDLLFLSRLANNEALYIHREIPPSKNDLHRVILIDASLKNWGTPKIIAFAVMLAISKHPKTDIDCAAFVIGDGYYPISIDSIHSIIDGLQIVEGSLHAVNGLTSFFKDFPNHKDREIFFITESSTVKNHVLARAMQDYQTLINYLILTDADGAIDVYKRSLNGKKHLQHILLPLNQLWKKTARKKSFQPSDTKGSFPILFKNPTNSKRTVSLFENVFKLTNNKNLFRLSNHPQSKQQKGWDLVYQGAPFVTDNYAIGLLDNGSYLMSMFNKETKEIVLINISTGEKKSVKFVKPVPKQISPLIFNLGRFLIATNDSVWSITTNGDIESGDDVEFKIFNEKITEQNRIAGLYNYGGNVLKKINVVAINNLNELVFNAHALRLITNGNHIRLLNSGGGSEAKITAIKRSHKEFEFNEGSLIEIHPAGMLILRSSNQFIPPIYIPTSLDGVLGVATSTAFAGNEYYYKETNYDLVLKSPGENKLSCVKLIMELTGKGLKDAKETVDNSPAPLIVDCPKERATHIKITLETNGAKVEIAPTNSTQQTGTLQKISTPIFYKKYIESFIKTIQSHGTSH
jgi:ribosomal protein L7/L12